MNDSVLYTSNEKRSVPRTRSGNEPFFHISGLMPCIYYDDRIVRSIENFIIV